VVGAAANPRNRVDEDDDVAVTVRNLGSGSSGNAVLISSPVGTVAVDCGVGARALALGLRAAGTALADLDAVLLTHEHADHVRSLPAALAVGVPIVCTAGTAGAASLPSQQWQPIARRGEAVVAGLLVRAIPVAHDAAEPCGYVVSAEGVRVVVVTDLGSPSDELAEHLADADLIVVEANHDEMMLRNGPYPERLKQRVLSASGHLSNADCGLLLARALSSRGRLRTIWLAHLSTTNNRPGLAQRAVVGALAARGASHIVEPLVRHGHHQVWHSSGAGSTSRQLAFDLSD